MYSYIIARLTVIFVLQNWAFVTCHAHHEKNSTDNEALNPVLDFLGVAENAIYKAKKHAENDIRSTQNFLYSYPMDCAEIHDKNISAKGGIFKIWPRSRFAKVPLNVYCDMEDDGGAWTVIQRRGDFDSSKSYFYRDWASYKNGFGDALKDFWIGNDNIFSLTNQRDNMVKFVLRDWEGNQTYATYDDFWMDDERHNYTMHVGGYRGNAGDSFSFTNGIPFSTKDRDHDNHEKSCAVMFKGAWWYASCHSSNLNGQYLKGTHESYADGVEWSAFRGQRYSLKDTVIKIRPKDFIKEKKLDLTPQ